MDGIRHRDIHLVAEFDRGDIGDAQQVLQRDAHGERLVTRSYRAAGETTAQPRRARRTTSWRDRAGCIQRPLPIDPPLGRAQLPVTEEPMKQLPDHAPTIREHGHEGGTTRPLTSKPEGRHPPQRVPIATGSQRWHPRRCRTVGQECIRVGTGVNSAGSASSVGVQGSLLTRGMPRVESAERFGFQIFTLPVTGRWWEFSFGTVWRPVVGPDDSFKAPARAAAG